MTNAIIAANDRPSPTNRRTVLGAILAGAATALPATVANAAPLSPADHRARDLWRRYRKLRDIHDRLDEEAEKSPDRLGFGPRIDAVIAAWVDTEMQLRAKARASVLALGGALILEINEGYEFQNYDLDISVAALTAIRPMLVGEIAEDADRALATKAQA